MNKNKEELKKELNDLRALRQEILNGAKGQPCEVYSRIVGYLREIKAWNPGRAQEFKDRKTYKI